MPLLTRCRALRTIKEEILDSCQVLTSPDKQSFKCFHTIACFSFCILYATFGLLQGLGYNQGRNPGQRPGADEPGQARPGHQACQPRSCHRAPGQFLHGAPGVHAAVHTALHVHWHLFPVVRNDSNPAIGPRVSSCTVCSGCTLPYMQYCTVRALACVDYILDYGLDNCLVAVYGEAHVREPWTTCVSTSILLGGPRSVPARCAPGVACAAPAAARADAAALLSGGGMLRDARDCNRQWERGSLPWLTLGAP